MENVENYEKRWKIMKKEPKYKEKIMSDRERLAINWDQDEPSLVSRMHPEVYINIHLIKNLHLSRILTSDLKKLVQNLSAVLNKKRYSAVLILNFISNGMAAM